MRIFTAVALPQPVKQSLAALTRTNIPGSRWEHPNDFHLTLRFIGDVDDSAYQRYATALTTVQPSAFNLVLQGVGRFPEQPSRTPKVLWVGVKMTPELKALHAAVSAVLEANGLPKDKFSDYSPHITLARFGEQQPLAPVDSFLRQHAAFQTEAIPVHEFVMYQNERMSDGAKYKQIKAFALRK